MESMMGELIRLLHMHALSKIYSPRRRSTRLDVIFPVVISWASEPAPKFPCLILAPCENRLAEKWSMGSFEALILIAHGAAFCPLKFSQCRGGCVQYTLAAHSKRTHAAGHRCFRRHGEAALRRTVLCKRLGQGRVVGFTVHQPHGFKFQPSSWYCCAL